MSQNLLNLGSKCYPFGHRINLEKIHRLLIKHKMIKNSNFSTPFPHLSLYHKPERIECLRLIFLVLCHIIHPVISFHIALATLNLS